MEASKREWWSRQDIFHDISAGLRKHLVGLLVIHRHEGEYKHSVASGILIEHSGMKLWVTAGHVLEELTQALKSCPASEFDARWIDNYLDAAQAMIPLSLSDLHCVWTNEKEQDFGAVSLTNNQVQLLTADNRSTFLNPMSWARNSEFQPDTYIMAGFPMERSAIEKITAIGTDDLVDLKFEAMTAAVEPLDVATLHDDHEFFRYPDAFYGKLAGFKEQQDIGSIEGMSGGPIFGISRERDRVRYRLFAIQGSWLPRRGVIRATRIEQFDSAMRSAIDTRSVTT